MQLDKLRGSGSTPSRRRFWDSVADVVLSLQKLKGHNTSVNEHPGSGTIIQADIRTGTTYGVVGACCIDGSCSLRTRTDCEGSGGNYLGDGTTCEDVDCTHGACCHPDGTCTIETPETCTDFYLGDGTTCEGVDCTHTGACCHPDNTCSITSEDGCEGSYQGDGTTCEGVDCSHMGACCHGGECTIETSDVCTLIGGVYEGDGTTCEGIDCTLPACCPGAFEAFDLSGRKFKTLTVTTTGNQDAFIGAIEQVTIWSSVRTVDACTGDCSCSGSGTEDTTPPGGPTVHCDITASGCTPDCPDGLCRWPDGTSGCGWVGDGSEGCSGPFGTSNMSACCSGLIPDCCPAESILGPTAKQLIYSCSVVPCGTVNVTVTEILSDECAP